MDSYILESKNCKDIVKLHKIFHKAADELMTDELMQYYWCVPELCEKTRHADTITPEITHLIYTLQELHLQAIKVSDAYE